MPLELYVGLEKFSCDLCGPGPRPTRTVVHVETGEKADICDVCYEKNLTYSKFAEGVKSGEIKVMER